MSFLIPFGRITRRICSTSPTHLPHPLTHSPYHHPNSTPFRPLREQCVVSQSRIRFSLYQAQCTKYSLPLKSRDLILVMHSADSTVNALSNEPNINPLVRKITHLPRMGTGPRAIRPAPTHLAHGGPTVVGSCPITNGRSLS